MEQLWFENINEKKMEESPKQRIKISRLERLCLMSQSFRSKLSHLIELGRSIFGGGWGGRVPFFM